MITGMELNGMNAERVKVKVGQVKLVRKAIGIIKHFGRKEIAHSNFFFPVDQAMVWAFHPAYSCVWNVYFIPRSIPEDQALPNYKRIKIRMSTDYYYTWLSL